MCGGVCRSSLWLDHKITTTNWSSRWNWLANKNTQFLEFDLAEKPLMRSLELISHICKAAEKAVKRHDNFVRYCTFITRPSFQVRKLAISSSPQAHGYKYVSWYHHRALLKIELYSKRKMSRGKKGTKQKNKRKKVVVAALQYPSIKNRQI